MTAPFSIVAEFPLGTFRGAAEDGRLDPLPSVSRLYSALLCAAGFGPRAVVDGDMARPSPPDEAALTWVEEHLPDTVAIPLLRSNLGSTSAYRQLGLVKSRPTPKFPDASVAVGGAFTWTWTAPPPDDVVHAIDALCGDVPYLGTSESPVRLRTTREAASVTHALDPEAGLFSGSGADIEVPLAGRLAELSAANTINLGKPPSVARDRAKPGGESEVRTTPPRDRVAIARYAPVGQASTEVPWPQLLVLPIDYLPPERVRVRWAGVLHKTLIASVGDGAPPLLTGTYPPGVARPANRVALQIVDGSLLPEIATKAAFVIMIPTDADAADVAAVSAAAASVTTIRGPGRQYPTRVGRVALVAGDAFWAPPAPGTVRAWVTSPPAVPDVRGWGPGWGFAEALALSFAYTWQGTTMIDEVTGRGEVRARALVDQARHRLGPIIFAAPLRTNRVHDYVHRVNEHAVVRPYRAVVMTGELGTDRTLQAVGQSRHLGGGLLVPVDLPQDDVDAAT